MFHAIALSSIFFLAYITTVFLPSFYIGTTDGESGNRPDLSVHPYLIRVVACSGLLIAASAFFTAGFMPFWVCFAGLIIGAVCAYVSGYAATARFNVAC